MRAAAWAAALAASAVLLAACGDDKSSTSSTQTTTDEQALELSIRSDDGAGRVASGKLVCAASHREATGDLAGGLPALERCRDARSLTGLLSRDPGRRTCTKLYGGPQTVHVTGTIGAHRIDKRFARTDGCEIKDYARLKPILPG